MQNCFNCALAFLSVAALSIIHSALLKSLFAASYFAFAVIGLLYAVFLFAAYWAIYSCVAVSFETVAARWESSSEERSSNAERNLTNSMVREHLSTEQFV